ncbi:MAG: hypothetical protein N3A72_01830 [bacterium]|nr:hypothetical protein [bacterium]
MQKLLITFILLTLAMSSSYGAEWLTPYLIDTDAAPGHGPITAATDASVGVSPDGKTLFICSNRAGGLGGYDIWISTTDASGRWTTPVNIGAPINTSFDEVLGASITADGRELYFCSRRTDIPGSTPDAYDLFVAIRSTANDPWSSATVLFLGAPISYRTMVGTAAGWGAECPYITPDGNTLYYGLMNAPLAAVTVATYSGYTYGNPYHSSSPQGFGQIWKSTKVGGVWQFPVFVSTTVNLGGTPDSGVYRTRYPWSTPNEKYLYFSSRSLASQEPWMSVKPAEATDWSSPALLTELDSPSTDGNTVFDAEMDRIFFISDRHSAGSANRRIYTAVGTLQIRLDGLPVDKVTLKPGVSTTLRARGGLKNYSWSTTGTGGSINTLTGRQVIFTALSRGTDLTLNEPGSVTPPAAPAQSTTIPIIIVPDPLVANPAGPVTLSIGQTREFFATGGTPPYSWSLSTTGIGSITTTANSVTFTAEAAGNVDLILTDAEPTQTVIHITVIPTSAPIFPNKEAEIIQSQKLDLQ